MRLNTIDIRPLMPQVVNSSAAELCVACKKVTLQIAYFY